MIYGWIYVLRNTVNGKCYVGQTTQEPSMRFKQHVKERSHCVALKAAFAKYGAEAFEMMKFGRAADKAVLDAMEIEAIAILGSIAPGGYNLRAGGSWGTHGPEARQKISKATKGRTVSDSHRELMRQRMLGTSPSPETRAKISATLTGRPLAEERHAAMKGRGVGRRHTEESKAKMKANRAGIPMTEEGKKKLRAANLGKKHSEEIKAKMTAAQTARWAQRRALTCPI
jgi:group I intron endonuclease